MKIGFSFVLAALYVFITAGTATGTMMFDYTPEERASQLANWQYITMTHEAGCYAQRITVSVQTIGLLSNLGALAGPIGAALFFPTSLGLNIAGLIIAYEGEWRCDCNPGDNCPGALLNEEIIAQARMNGNKPPEPEYEYRCIQMRFSRIGGLCKHSYPCGHCSR